MAKKNRINRRIRNACFNSSSTGNIAIVVYIIQKKQQFIFCTLSLMPPHKPTIFSEMTVYLKILQYIEIIFDVTNRQFTSIVVHIFYEEELTFCFEAC